METLLLVPAMIVAFFLLFRTIAAPQRPQFNIGERLPPHAAIYRIKELAKRCTATERGNGIAFLKPLRGVLRVVKRVEKRISDGKVHEEWEEAVYNGRAKIYEAVKRCRREMPSLCTLGHVGGVPRIYLLCDEIVKMSRGCFSQKTLTAEITAFDGIAALSYGELKVLPIVVSFCILGLLSITIESSLDRASLYDKGVSDKEFGRCDLDALYSPDYICGLEIGDGDAALMRIAELNDISFESARNEHRARLAAAACICATAVGSLNIVLSLDGDAVTAMSEVDAALRRFDFYRSGDTEYKARCFRAVEKEAKIRGCSTAAVARDIDIAALVSDNKNEKYRAVIEFLPFAVTAVVLVVIAIVGGTLERATLLASAVTLAAAFGEIFKVFSLPFDGAEASGTDARRKGVIKILYRIIGAALPYAQIVLCAACTAAYSVTLFLCIVAPVFARTAVSICRAAENSSARELIKIPAAISSFSTAPAAIIKNLSQVFKTAKNRVRTIWLCAAQAATGILFIAVNAAAGGSAAMFTVGALYFFAAFSDPFGATLKLLNEKISRRVGVPSYDKINRRNMPVKFFCGKSKNTAYAYINPLAELHTDSRGNVMLSSGSAATKIGVSVSCGDDFSVSLCDFDTALQPFKSIYRTILDSAEISVEFVSSPSYECAARITVINKTPSEKSYRIAVSCYSPPGVSDFKSEKVKDVGIVYTAGSSVVGLCSDTDCSYGESLEHGDGIYTETVARIFGECVITADAFSTASAVFGAVIGAERNGIVSLASFSDDTVFTRAEFLARAYYPSSFSQSISDEAENDTRLFICSTPAADTYSELNFSNVEYDIDTAVGGFTDGVFDAPISDLSHAVLLKNRTADGELFVETAHNGDGRVFYKGIELTKPAHNIPRIGVCIGENGVIWSPFGALAGKNARVKFGRGFSKYTSGRNGCKTVLKRFTAFGKDTEMFLLEIENMRSDDRKLEVMFYVFADDGIRAVRRGDCVCLLDKKFERNFAMLSSHKPVETCLYAEGYYDHGGIKRTRGFTCGGDTVAPALSIDLSLVPDGVATAVFGVSAIDYSACTVDLIGLDAIAAEEEFNGVLRRNSEVDAVVLKSSDSRLNNAHALSAYMSHTGLYIDMIDHRADRALIRCFAVKYLDPELVLNTLERLCAEQYADGRFYCGRYSDIATMLLPIVAADIAEYVGDYSVFDRTVDYNGDGELSHKKTVIEHCYKAVDAAINTYLTERDRYKSFCCRLLLYKAIKVAVNFCGDERLRYYSSCASAVMQDAYDDLKKLASAEAECDPIGAVTAAARYATGEAENAYDAVKILTDGILNGKYGPLVFSNPDDVTFSLYYAVVNQCLLGVKINGDRARVTPDTSSVAPHIEFDLKRGDTVLRIAVDDSVSVGAWQMNIDRISYASDRIKLTEPCNRIVMRRSG